MNGSAGQPRPGAPAFKPRCFPPMSTTMPASTSAIAALLVVGAVACGNAEAAPVSRAAPAAAPLASVQLVDRLEADGRSVLPDVTGLTATDARAALHGLRVQVVDFGRRRDPISAQYPMAGQARPDDGVVIVWVGTPPQTSRARPKAAAAPGAALVTTPGGPVPVEPTPPAAPVGAAPKPPPKPEQMSTVVTAPGSGATPGLENFVPPPHGPRANIRTLAPAEAGSAFAGRASWYGPGFAGRGTACGTTFDPGQLTLASRELRCGTKVLVTGPSGSVDATVTDWGPAEWTDRRFDLSEATFEAVASLGSGVIDVTVEVR